MKKKSPFFWTPERDRVLREAAGSARDDEDLARMVSERLRYPLSRSAVCSRRTRLGIPPPIANRYPTLPSMPSVRVEAPPLDIPVYEDLEEETHAGAGRDTHPPDGPPPASSDQEAEERVFSILSDLTKRGSVTLEEACDALEMSPRMVREWIGVARTRGYRFEVDGAEIGRRPTEEPSRTHDVAVQAAGERHVIAAVGDIHFGSKHHLRSYFRDFCGTAYERGARVFLHVGDMLDGCYKHSQWEQSARGYEEQVNVAIAELPRWKDARWYWIQGNHDETLGEASGLEVGRAVEQSFRAAGRDDVIYLGPRAAYVRLHSPGEKRGLFVELWHPRDKASAYAKSYRLQKKIEKYAPGSKPDVLLSGHWHQSMFLTTRGVHAISAGCWQGGQSSFGKSLGGSPDIGSWILEYALTEQGAVRSFRPEWVAYYETETVRDVGLG